MFKPILAAFLALCFTASMAAVDANKGTVADLDSVKGIGPGTSAKIIEARTKAPFKNWDDLIARVPGIGEKRALKLSGEGLTVQGEAYKAATKVASAPEKSAKKEKEKAAPAKPSAEEKKPTKP